MICAMKAMMPCDAKYSQAKEGRDKKNSLTVMINDCMDGITCIIISNVYTVQDIIKWSIVPSYQMKQYMVSYAIIAAISHAIGYQHDITECHKTWYVIT